MAIYIKVIVINCYFIGMKTSESINQKLNFKKITIFCEKSLTRGEKFYILSFPNAGERIGDD